MTTVTTASTPRARPGDESDVVDLVGVGFGPGNLALAIAIEEHNAESAPERWLRAVFVDKHPHFCWHPGMLLPGSTMQIAFAKDLVTPRKPTSGYSFFSYLHENGRLPDFINHQTFFPSRYEFADYLAWAAARVAADVRYGTTVRGLDLSGPHAVVDTDAGTLRARTVVAAPGLEPRLPEGISPGSRVFHNHRVLDDLAALGENRNGAYAVVGAGQSAAEVIAHLHATRPEAHVHAVFTRFGLSPSDDSPFANRIFDPATVDRWYQASDPVRERLVAYHRATNYAAVDPDLITDLYSRVYHEQVTGERRLHFHNAFEVTDLREEADQVHLTIRDTMSGEIAALCLDAVIFATGYRPTSIARLVTAGAERYRSDDHGLVVRRDHQLAAIAPDAPRVFLHGGTERTHGLGSTLLSNLAVRAGEILSTLTRSPVDAG